MAKILTTPPQVESGAADEAGGGARLPWRYAEYDSSLTGLIVHTDERRMADTMSRARGP